MKQNNRLMIVYTILHFFVDFTTIFLICGILLGPSVGVVNRGLVIVTYNIVAFAGQLPLGIIADYINKNRQMTAFGCILACISYPLAFYFPWVACVVASVGNGAFHIGAGADVLKFTMPKAGMSGLFVSTGALGVWLAYKASGAFVTILCPVLMIIFSVVLLAMKDGVSKNDTIKAEHSQSRGILILAVICFMLTIVIRSFLGMIMNFDWKSVPILSLLFVVSVMGGKALGGFLGDRFGYVKTAVVSLVISLVAFAFSFDLWFAGIVAVLCFNMTMPLTLTAIAGVCNKKYGSAFGLTTFALAVGFMPVVFGTSGFFGLPLLTVMVAASLLFMVAGYVLLKIKKGAR